MDNGKTLVILNIHNSAFDTTGAMRKHELDLLSERMVHEYNKGNYVISGGDWNNNPRNFNISSIISGDPVFEVNPQIESNFLPGWKFIFDPSQPSNRNVVKPYHKGETKTTIIDFCVLSPNIEEISSSTILTGFQYSDHQPLLIKVKLLE